MRTGPFGLTDAMMLVVAAALGLWVNRTDWEGFKAFGYGDSYAKIQRVLILVTPHLAATTMVLAAIRLWRPRPPLRRLLRLQARVPWRLRQPPSSSLVAG